MQVVQAVPGTSVRVAIDGRQVRTGVDEGTVLGPYPLSAGRHSVTFAAPSGDLSTSASLTVRPGSSSDVVLHSPAAVGGKPVVNVYSTPRKPIGPGKARVLVAHTATVAPADVRVDGKVVFTNIANGEFAEADVPAGSHQVALLPTGQKSHPILGPLDVTLAPRTVTMVYAVGRPSNGSMDVIAHAAPIASDGTVRPAAIKTGSAGLAAHTAVSSFGTDPGQGGHVAGGRSPLPGWLWLSAVGAAALCGGRIVVGRPGRPGRLAEGRLSARPGPRGRSRPGPRAVLVAGGVAALVTLAAVLAVPALRSPSPAVEAAPVASTPRTGGTPEASVTSRAAVPARRLPGLVTPEAPVAIRLPTGRVVPVTPVSTRADGTLDVPHDITTSGWWRGGSRVGDPFGSMVVAAHIDSVTQGLGPYAALLTVRAGQRVRVTTRHLRQDFVIRSRRLVPQGSLVHERWLFSPAGAPRLMMVTCAPPYDSSRGGYQNLAVVTAAPVADPVSR